jgi:transcriptional regulator with XRE-family HTH domain
VPSTTPGPIRLENTRAYQPSISWRSRYSGAVVDDTRLLGARLRAIRAERGLSLSAVAEATGISTSFLSLVETGKNDITFGRLRRLIDYYGVTLIDLLPPAEDTIVVREAERQHLHFPTEGVDVYVLVPGVENDNLYAAIAVYERDSQVEESGPFEGVVLITVLEGSIVLEFTGAETITLGVGDSAYYNASREHRVRTGPDEGARFIYIAAVPPDPFAVGGWMGGAVP